MPAGVDLLSTCSTRKSTKYELLLGKDPGRRQITISRCSARSATFQRADFGSRVACNEVHEPCKQRRTRKVHHQIDQTVSSASSVAMRAGALSAIIMSAIWLTNTAPIKYQAGAMGLPVMWMSQVTTNCVVPPKVATDNE